MSERSPEHFEVSPEQRAQELSTELTRLHGEIVEVVYQSEAAGVRLVEIAENLARAARQALITSHDPND